MANEVFPPTLPGVLLAPYTGKEIEHFESNDVQSGPPRIELQTSVTPAMFSASWNFSPFDFQLFEGWYSDRITFASKVFDMSLPVGAGDLVHECQFKKSYTFRRRGQRVIVSAELIVSQKHYNTTAEIDALFILAEMTSDPFQSVFFEAFNVFAETSLPDSWAGMKMGTDFS